MGKKKKRKNIKSKVRIFFAIFIYVLVTAALCNNCLSIVRKIQEKEKEKISLKNEHVTINEDNEALENELLMYDDPEYLAKYIREKYLYSKDGELKLRLDE